MLIAPPHVLRTVQEAIVKASHGLVNENGEPMLAGTLDEARLGLAALLAVQLAAGDVVWPGDKRIDLPRPVQQTGVFAGMRA